MSDDRPRTRLSVSIAGAIALLVSTLVPWYGVAITERGARALDEAGERFAAEYGNADLQAKASEAHSTIATLVGHQLTTLTAHRAHGTIGVALLVLGSLALLIALTALLPSGFAVPDVGEGTTALLGVLAALLTLYCIVAPPAVGEGYFAYSLKIGPWIALLASLSLIAAGVWPHRTAAAPSSVELQDALSSLSGWTPDT